jgi:hypothetical protein
VFLALLFAGAVTMGVFAIVAPWSFYMGGHFRMLPMWTGWGKAHSRNVGDYVWLISFYPSTGRFSGLRHLKGNGVICTPRGEKYKLLLGGDFEKGSGTDLQGKGATFYMNNNSVIARNLGGSLDPHLELRGKWNNPDLVLDDHGSLNRSFAPDGSLIKNHAQQPYMQEVVPITVHEGSTSDFDAACAALKAH